MAFMSFVDIYLLTCRYCKDVARSSLSKGAIWLLQVSRNVLFKTSTICQHKSNKFNVLVPGTLITTLSVEEGTIFKSQLAAVLQEVLPPAPLQVEFAPAAAVKVTGLPERVPQVAVTV